MKIVGKTLLFIGAILIVVTVFQIISSGQLAEVEAMEINDPDKLSFYWSPITAVAFVVAGTIVLIVRKKAKRRSHRYYG